ncbi:MAG: hypothetical protein AB8B99_12130 [Phormidesmis sp.]
MTRLMIFAVIVIVMAVLAIQNQDATALTILGSRQTPAMPFGLLLVGAFSAGTLLTIFLYGLVGLQRPPESKYRPMGRRVPYPDSPGSTNLPPSGPSTNTASSPYATAGQSYGSTSAFVSEPSPQSTSPQSTPPQDTPPQGTSFQNSSVQPQDSSSQSSSSQSSYHAPNTSPSAASAAASSSYVETNRTNSNASTPPIFPDTPASPSTPSVVDTPEPEKKKNRFQSLSDSLSDSLGDIGKKINQSVASQPPTQEKRIGDDWGELRTAEHINSWDADEVRSASGLTQPTAKRGLLDFIGVGTANPGAPSADRLTDDIATGWDGTPGDASYEDGAYGSRPYDDRAYENGPYEEGLDRGWEQDYGSEANNGAKQPQRRVYRDGIYSDGDYQEGPYEQGAYEQQPYEEGPYAPPYEEEGPYETADEIGPEGVYEADYRVIEPPSKPLEEIEKREEDEPPYT